MLALFFRFIVSQLQNYLAIVMLLIVGMLCAFAD